MFIIENLENTESYNNEIIKYNNEIVKKHAPIILK